MEKQLFQVKIVLYVMAENEADAYTVASRVQFDNSQYEVSKAAKIEPEWMDAIPYNADNDQTCSEIAFNKQLPAHTEICTRPIPCYAESKISVFNLENSSFQVKG